MTVVSLPSQRSRRPLLLDLFCGAGGAARGYYDAGFDVVGIDLYPQPRYPYRFIQDDAIETLETILEDGFLHCYDDNGIWILGSEQIAAIHASPPCQGYSVTRFVNRDKQYPRLIEPTREVLKSTGLPYVIENVQTAPLIDPVVLCGSHFGLTCWWPGNGRVGLRRHRLFESNILIPDPGPHDHSLLSVPVYGGGPSGKKTPVKGPGHAQACKDVMGIDWMTRDEIEEALPPAYCEYVGGFLLNAINQPLAA